MSVDICECHEEYEQTLKGEYFDCIDECERYNSPPLIEDCMDECNRDIDRQLIDECGELPDPLYEVIYYKYKLIATYDQIPFDPIYNTSKWVTTPLSSTIWLNSDFSDDPVTFVDIQDLQLPSNWSSLITGNNVCFGIYIEMAYESTDTPNKLYECGGYIWDCKIIG